MRSASHLSLSFAAPSLVMPRSVSSQHASPTVKEEADEEDERAEEEEEEIENLFSSHTSIQTPTSPAAARRLHSARTSELDLRSRRPSRLHLDEHSSLLAFPEGLQRNYVSEPNTSIPEFARHQSVSSSIRIPRNHSRASSWGFRGAGGTGPDRRSSEAGLAESRTLFPPDERVWYDQFTSTDWVHDSIADGFRLRDLRARKDIRGRVYAWLDGAQGWILVALIGCITAIIAYFVSVTETAIFDIKEGCCDEGWYYSKTKCCYGEEGCTSWRTWGDRLNVTGVEKEWIDFIGYVFFVVLFSTGACLLTLTTKTVIPSAFSISTLDENLGADDQRYQTDPDALSIKVSESLTSHPEQSEKPSSMVYYPAAGSGVAEVKVILSGFVVHGYLGVQTLVVKTFALILSVSSGLSLGKEGPYVHIATCVGNIASRLFSKYNQNDGKRREVLSASAASGVGVAFGAPIGGVLFSLEEVRQDISVGHIVASLANDIISYYFPPKTLFRTFFCCIAAALSLKFLNPYGTGKIVIFAVRYSKDWVFFEIFVFILLGILGGATGAIFIKASRIWATTFRRIPMIKKWPLLEVVLVALVTGVSSFWNRYTKLPVTELLFEVASPCDVEGGASGLCPARGEDILHIIRYLSVAFIIKSILTTITFGIKVPAGIYVPSMVVGGLLGRMVGHVVQYVVFTHPDWAIFSSCPKDKGLESCVTPGVYALVAAGATMCGVTRLSVTLAVILFELTGSLDHVLPFSLSVLVAKWTADAIEPHSIYDLLTDMNSYPFLDNKIRPIFTTNLGAITPKTPSHRVIDLSNSPLVPARSLRRKLDRLHDAGEIDGGLPVVRHGVLVGLIPAPDLEFALDKLEDEEQVLCLMAHNIRWQDTEEDEMDEDPDPTDFTPYIDPAPVALDIHSPMDLAFQCFVKLGLRYICVLKEGQYAGLIHKKNFVKYLRELEKKPET